MRSLVLAVLLLGLVITPAEARPRRGTTQRRRVATELPASRDDLPKRARTRVQSIGAPWSGRLENPARLRDGDGYVIRRPWRSFGTRTTVELIRDAVTATLAELPHAHVLAIGDLSQETGGQITEHHSHQSGRDVDIGLFYKKKPATYPTNFVTATADNLDCAATWKLLSAFAATADQDGGAQVIFLDFNVQGLLYRWAKDHDVSDKRLDRLFQFPHGRGASEGLVRHEPNHDNHLHVRFKCSAHDTACK